MSGIISARAWGKVWAYRSTFLLGLLNTVETAIFAILLALVLGVIFGLMATSGKKILQVISRVYVEIMQNTPILLQLCFFYYALAFSGHSIGILPTGIVALGVYTGAYMAEVVRAGIESSTVPGIHLCGADVLYHPSAKHQDHFTTYGKPDREPDQKHLLPVHYRRSRSDLADLQLCHRGKYRWCLCTGISGQRTTIFHYMLSTLQDSQCLGDSSEEKGSAGDIPKNRRAGDRQ